MAVVLGRLLGIAFLVCFGTGLYSHFLQEPLPWMVFPTRPQTLYQLSQGIHITAGIACFPLILAKLYVVFPELFQTPPIKNFVGFLERASIAIFVASSLVQIVTGLLNTYQWYPFPFPFKQTHFALSFVIIGSLALHIAVKLPVISRYWTRSRSFDSEGNLLLDDEDLPLTPADVAAELADTTAEPVGPISRRVDGLTGRLFDWIDSAPPRVDTPKQARVSRRGFVATVGVATAAVVALTAGQSFRVLDAINVFGPRKNFVGPNDLPINRTAKAAQVTDADTGADWALSVSRGSVVKTYTRADLESMTLHSVDLPIACVEGWSQMASWRGVRLRDLLDAVGAHPDEDLRLTSLEKAGGYRVTEMGHEFAQDELTLVALELNGDPLNMDHGYPARMIAPGRPGVLQTKWLSKLEVI
ncbi:molybdopterin-dependent oxidoreductase [Glaciihabitans sp. INWT7]|uniref:molybdopterin-dependent oxidoreductase n=1 Tax=Glaciihabitans sp. INWT7 TaxID=2596912 RepID=UPI0021038532|nr:molybdopterin-dependent oxidoreductase [Glaciihabitans sp. INWT7]